MKLIAVLLVSLFVINEQTYSQKILHPIFIAKDSISMERNFIYSRLIIMEKFKFEYPENLEISTASGSNFGYIEMESFDTIKRVFARYFSRTHVDLVPDYTRTYSRKSTNYLNIPFRLLPREAFDPGLYRARVRLSISRYNSGMKDAYSNWSYFFL